MRQDNNLYQIRDKDTNQLLHETESKTYALLKCTKQTRVFSINNATGKKVLVKEG